MMALFPNNGQIKHPIERHLAGFGLLLAGSSLLAKLMIGLVGCTYI